MRLQTKHPSSTIAYSVDLAPQLAAGELPIGAPTLTVVAGNVVFNPLEIDRTGNVVTFTLSGGTSWTDCLLRLTNATDKGEVLALDLELFIG